MSISNQKYYLDLSSGTRAPVTVHVSQGDVGRRITFAVQNGGEKYSFSGESVSVHGTRIDGANFGPISCTYSGSVVAFNTTSAMTAVAGSAIAELSIVNSSSEKVGTANFAILVEKSTFPDGVSYDTDPSVYEDILKYVQGMDSSITTNAIDTSKNYTDEQVSIERTARTIAIENERTARTIAIENEQSARTTTETALSNRISNLAVVSSSPNIAEVVDARADFSGTAQGSLTARLNKFLEYDVVSYTEGINIHG